MKKTMWQERHSATRRRMLAGIALGVLSLVGAPAPALARADYTFKTIDVPGASLTIANGNSLNAIVGEYDDAEGTHGFVLKNGKFTRIDVPGADGYSTVNGINIKGERSGLYFKDGRPFGYFYSQGKFTTLDPPDSVFSLGLFLNTGGSVVGYFKDAADTSHGYLWRNGAFTQLDAPEAGPGGTRAIGINDFRQIVGAYNDPNGRVHGFLLTRGVYKTLDVPGSVFTNVQGINNLGQIAGFYQKADGNSHGFVLSGGRYTTVDVPGALWTEVYSINGRGELVGTFEDANGMHGFAARRVCRPGDDR